MYFLKSMLHAPLLILAATLAAADDGCFSSVDTSVSKGSLQYGSQSSCSTACGTSYQYIAMKNGGDCYCLTSLPTTGSVSSSQCSRPCNGYGAANCGGSNAYTVFDNLNYDGSGVGTTSSSKSSSSSSSPSSSYGVPTGSSMQATGTAATSSSDSRTTTNAPGNTAASSTSDSVQYRTVTTTSGTASATSSSSSPSSSASATPNNSGRGRSTNIAPIVGGVVGGVAAVALGFVLFFFIRRRNAQDDDDEEDFFKKGPAGSANGGVSRAKSNKINSVFDMPMANPFEHPSDELSEKRSSRAAGGLTDPRLNPVMMGRKRLSEGSLADEADYSRKILGVTNP